MNLIGRDCLCLIYSYLDIASAESLKQTSKGVSEDYRGLVYMFPPSLELVYFVNQSLLLPESVVIGAISSILGLPGSRGHLDLALSRVLYFPRIAQKLVLSGASIGSPESLENEYSRYCNEIEQVSRKKLIREIEEDRRAARELIDLELESLRQHRGTEGNIVFIGRRVVEGVAITSGLEQRNSGLVMIGQNTAALPGVNDSVVLGNSAVSFSSGELVLGSFLNPLRIENGFIKAVVNGRNCRIPVLFD